MRKRGRRQRLVVMLTAIDLEREAVCAHLTDVEDTGNLYSSMYWRGMFVGNNSIWDVVVAQSGPGGLDAAIATKGALADHKPEIIFIVGVAGGRKDVVHGDIVFAKKVYAYESGKSDIEFLPRPIVKEPPFSVIRMAQAAISRKDWLKRLPGDFSGPNPNVHIGAIAAGESVITSPDSGIAQRLQAIYSDTLAVDMEDHGFLQAVYRHEPRVDAMVIRGISDLMHDKNQGNDTERQRIAARNASAFAFEMLDTLSSPHSYTIKKSPKIRPRRKPLSKPSRSGQNSNPLSNASVPASGLIPDDKLLKPPETPPGTLGIPEKKRTDITIAQRFFNGKLPVQPDQCDHATRLLKELDKLLKMFKLQIESSSINNKLMRVNHAIDQIDGLQSELISFKHLCRSGKLDQRYNDNRQVIFEKFGWLIENLDYISETL